MPSSSWLTWRETWTFRFENAAARLMHQADPGHGIEHVRRVVANASRLGELEQAAPEVILPAAWLHDCVLVPKNSPERSQASRLAAARGVECLRELDYPVEYHAAIEHAIVAHSFSANIETQTLEAKIVQDADRLEAVGAIGIARCLMTGGDLRQALYHESEPFPVTREADDRRQSIDHFFAKLLSLPRTMKTAAGRDLAQQRLQIMLDFLICLADEIGSPRRELEQALHRLPEFKDYRVPTG